MLRTTRRLELKKKDFIKIIRECSRQLEGEPRFWKAATEKWVRIPGATLLLGASCQWVRCWDSGEKAVDTRHFLRGQKNLFLKHLKGQNPKEERGPKKWEKLFFQAIFKLLNFTGKEVRKNSVKNGLQLLAITCCLGDKTKFNFQQREAALIKSRFSDGITRRLYHRS